MTKQEYYSLSRIKKKNATYNVIFGERSNGKTYACLEEGIRRFIKNGSQLAYVRRWKEDVTGKRAKRIFQGINESGVISKITDDYSGVTYLNGSFFLCNYDEKGNPVYNEGDRLGYTFALSETEHDKSTSFPRVRMIIFDEFLTKNMYLQDEFVLFMNTVSTIVRRRTDVEIFMLGNTVNKYAPYFDEMGLSHIKQMEQGTIDIYKYGDSGLSVAVEYCKSMEQSKGNNHYFAFNNPKLEMITGGAWEMNIYPHLPMKYKPSNILFTYFILFNDLTFQCEIIEINDVSFTYIHEKTTPIKYEETDLIYSFEYEPRLNYNRNILKPFTKLQQNILWFFKHDKVFYQSNAVGDSIANYIKLCGG